MPKDTLATRLLNLDGFQRKYKPLLFDSIMRQFPVLNKSKEYLSLVDLDYLIKCASILAQSNEGICQDAALRIAQYTLSSSQISEVYAKAATIILDTMTNYPAISLAQKRNYISEQVSDDLPVPIIMDMLKRKMAYSLWNDANNKMIPINRFQESVFRTCMNTDAVSISDPTSSGKSYILLQVMLELLQQASSIELIYIVPTRALIQQVSTDINDILRDNHITDVLITSVPVIIDDKSKKHVYVFTQERLHWLLDEFKLFIPDVLIVDEAQKIGDGTRGVILQQAIEEASHRNMNMKVIFASPMTENPNILLGLLTNNLEKTDLLSEQVTVNQNLLWVNCINAKEKIWSMDLCLNAQKVDLGTFTTPFRADTVSKRMPFIAFALSDNDGGNLIYVNGAADAEKVARILYDLQAENVDDPDINELIKLVKNAVHKKYDLAYVLNRRIAFHYGNMPLLIKNEIERLFKNGIIKYLVCTSTLIEGVNLPARSIFVRAPQKGRNRPMDAVDFWNLSGRAGRQGKEFQGNIICIDTNDTELWKESLYMEKKKYPIRSSVDEMLRSKHKEIIQYIENDISGSLKSRDQIYEHVITYLLIEYHRSEGLFNSRIKSIISKDDLYQLNYGVKTILDNVEIPYEILSRHHGVSPIAQQALLNYFKGYKKDIIQLIPLMPEDYNAVESYTKIISRIQIYIEKQRPSKIVFYRAMLVVKWMRGYAMARIISENEHYFNSPKAKTPKRLPAIIRDTMRDIEDYVRFLFVKYSACYIDILRFFFEISQRNDLISQIPRLNIWLEFGASQDTQISLMNLGLSRTTAIALSEFITADSLNVKQCIKWIEENDINQLDLSIIIKEEIKRVVRSSYLSVEVHN